VDPTLELGRAAGIASAALADGDPIPGDLVDTIRPLTAAKRPLALPAARYITIVSVTRYGQRLWFATGTPSSATGAQCAQRFRSPSDPGP
jgi:hypothetical protein